MRTSVILVTHRRPADLEDALASIVAQRRLPDEVLVVAHGSDSLTPPVVEAWTKRSGGLVRFLGNPRADALTTGRNVGIDAAQGDVLVFLDDDVVLDPAYLDVLLSHFEAHPETLGAQGHWAAGAPWNAKSRLKAAFAACFGLTRDERRRARVLRTGHLTYPLRPVGPIDCMWLSGCNMAYRREVFQSERFDERLLFGSYGEDWDFSHRVWMRRPGSLVLLPEARLVHNSSPVTRAPTPQLVLRREAYSDHLHRVHFGDSLLTRALRAWSKLGEAFQYAGFMLFARRSPRGYHRAYFSSWRAARRVCRRHRAQIEAGDLSFVETPGVME